MKKNVLALALLSASVFASTGNATPVFLDRVSGDVIGMFSKRTPVSVFLGTTAVVGTGFALYHAWTPVKFALTSVHDGGAWLVTQSGFPHKWRQFETSYPKIASTVRESSYVAGGLGVLYGALAAHHYLNS